MTELDDAARAYLDAIAVMDAAKTRLIDAGIAERRNNLGEVVTP